MLPSINKHDHFCGNVNSKIVFVIYEDYECEDCGRAYRELKKLLEYFTENICIVYRQFPLFNKHPSAFLAALTAEAGTQYNKFNEIRDLILENQECLEYGLGGIWHLIEKEHILSKEQLYKDENKENEKLKRKIDSDIRIGLQKGVKNTPTIFINDYLYKGAVNFESLSKIIWHKMGKNKHDFSNAKRINFKTSFLLNFKKEHLLEWHAN